jgi:hypothetical protein
LLLFALVSQASAQLSNTPDFGLPPRHQPSTIAASALGALPHQTQVELSQLYRSYVAVVKKRREMGWHTGLFSGELVEHPDEPMIPARQLEDSIVKRQAELKTLEDALAREKAAPAAAAPAIKPETVESSLADWSSSAPTGKAEPRYTETELAVRAKKKELKRFQRQLGRSKGLSIDWSDAVWAELLKLDTPSWSVTDQARQTTPLHNGTVLCTPPENPALCLVFDPWKNGEPDVYAYDSWNEGSLDSRIAPDYFLNRLPDAP